MLSKFKMEILNDFRNDLLKRQEISLSLEADNNPNFKDIKKQVAEQFKKGEEVIDVYNIKGSFGSNEFKIDVYIYDTKEDLKKAEQKTKKQIQAEKKESEEAQAKSEDEKSSGEEEQKPEEKSEEKIDEKPEESSGEESASVEEKKEEVKEEPKEESKE